MFNFYGINMYRGLAQALGKAHLHGRSLDQELNNSKAHGPIAKGSHPLHVNSSSNFYLSLILIIKAEPT